MIWETLRGHHAQVDMFRRAVTRGRLSHAYLFHGPHGTGKRQFARRLTQCLLCETVPDEELDACGRCNSCRMMQGSTHPDCIELSCPTGKAVFPIEIIAGDRDHRGTVGLCHDIALRPTCGDRRIAIVDDAEKFNLESANALLKTLEEPPDYATLILIADDPDSLPTTIRSRCQLVRFAPLTERDVAGLLQDQGLVQDSSQAGEITRLSDGSLDTARQLLNDDVRRLKAQIDEALSGEDFHSAKLTEAVTELVQSFGDVPAQRKAAGWVIRFCIGCVSRQLTDAEQAGSAERLEILSRMIDRAVETARQIESNVQVALCLHALFDDLSRLQRAAVIA